jgi:vacuolar protein sorting-associated protein 26
MYTVISHLIKGEDDISGVVEVRMNKNKKIEHLGIRIELIGRIGIFDCD